MKQLNAEFIIGASNVAQFPNLALPEVAFCGRSNVGKSSLLNSIVLNNRLAKISSTPGKTKEINFFLVDEKWVFADLPGFGYAAVGKDLRLKWTALNWHYLENRENLRLVCVLVDSRHDPMEQDLATIERLEFAGRHYLIVLTKCDKISKSAVEQRKQQLEHLVSQCQFAVEVLPYSSVKMQGREELLAILKRFLG